MSYFYIFPRRCIFIQSVYIHKEVENSPKWKKKSLFVAFWKKNHFGVKHFKAVFNISLFLHDVYMMYLFISKLSYMTLRWHSHFCFVSWKFYISEFLNIILHYNLCNLVIIYGNITQVIKTDIWDSFEHYFILDNKFDVFCM